MKEEDWTNEHIVYNVGSMLYDAYDEAGMFLRAFDTKAEAREGLIKYSKYLDDAKHK